MTSKYEVRIETYDKERLKCDEALRNQAAELKILELKYDDSKRDLKVAEEERDHYRYAAKLHEREVDGLREKIRYIEKERDNLKSNVVLASFPDFQNLEQYTMP